MGNSARASVFFGIVIMHDEIPEEFTGDWQWEVAYAATKNEHEPAMEYDENDAALCAEYAAYWGRRRALAEACPCEVNLVGYLDGYGHLMVMAKASVTDASDYVPAPFNARPIDPAWERQIREFCEAIDIPFTSPRWWLASSYG